MKRLTRQLGILGVVLSLSMLATPYAASEDIDLFTGVNPAGGNIPTVLLYLHNTRNANANVSHGCTYNDTNGDPALGNTVGGMEQCAMVNALLSIKQNTALLRRINVGIMVFNNSSNFASFDNGSLIDNGNGECGYMAYVPTLMDSEGIDKLVKNIKSYSDNTFLVPDRAVGDGMASAWAMLNGLKDNCANIDYSTLGEVATECRDAVVVYIGNLTKTTAKAEDAPNGNGRVDTLLQGQLTKAFGYSENSPEYQLFTSKIDVTGLKDNGLRQADDWARFMKRVNVDDSAQSDRNITSYTIGVYDPELLTKIQGEVNYLAEMAKQGGGKAFTVQASQSQGFEDILTQIFTEVQAVNSVFSSATLPVSANTQGTFLNQVYIAMFRPDGQAGPRWFGNVKQYQLGFDSGGNIVLADANQDTSNAVSATNPNTGALTDRAVSFWTTNTPSYQVDWPANGYWINDPNGTGLQFDSPDGDLVEKGGAGQMARVEYLTQQDSRKVLSCAAEGKCGTGFIDFTRANFSTNGDKLFGLTAGAGGGAEVLAGTITKLGVDYNCTKSGNTTNCVFTAAAGFTLPDLRLESGKGNSKVPGDKVHIENLGQTDCTRAAPCDVGDVGQVGGEDFFTVTLNSMGVTSGSATIVLYQYSATAVVDQSAHGYSAGEEIELQKCARGVGESIDFNLGQIVTDTGVFLTEVATVLSNDSYSVVLDNVALGDVKLTCGAGTSSLTAANLIDWIRGKDNAGNESSVGPCPLNSDGTRTDNDGNACSINVRSSIHGDVLHSRPAVINYGDLDSDNVDGEADVVVFYGSNDGVYRAINGNQKRSIGNVRAGEELWSFVAPEFFTRFKRLFNDDPRINYTGIIDPDAVPRDYFFDGTTTILQDERSPTVAPATGKKSFIFLSARRGGALLYAIDVTIPSEPKFLWKKSNKEIPELGQTWSQPRVVQVKGHANPVLIFGAGYDGAEDNDPAPVVADIGEGRGIVVLDVVDGSLVWAALADCAGVIGATVDNCVDNTTLTNKLERPIAADIALVDNDFDGFIDRLYASDLGGNIWRVDLQPTAGPTPENWAISKFASIAGAGNDARKFFFAPSVVPTGTKDPFDIVVAVTGDREKPLYTDKTTEGLAYNVNNRFYVFVDKNSGDSVADGTAVITESDLADRTEMICLDANNKSVKCSYDAGKDAYVDAGGTVVTLITLNEIAENFSGYYITLDGSNDADNGDSEGEKGINAPLVFAGKAFFGTNQPDIPAEGSCTANLGIARGYKVDIFTGGKTVHIFAGGGMPPSPIAGLVTIDGQTVPFMIGGEGESAFDPSVPDLDLSEGRRRSYWYYK